MTRSGLAAMTFSAEKVPFSASPTSGMSEIAGIASRYFANCFGRQSFQVESESATTLSIAPGPTTAM